MSQSASKKLALEDTLTQISDALQKKGSTRPSKTFQARVLSIDDDKRSARIRLCTGSTLNAPIDVFKRVIHSGTVTVDDECSALVRAEFEESTRAGAFLKQLALEVERLSYALNVAAMQLQRSRARGSGVAPEVQAKDGTAGIHPPFDVVEPATIVKIDFNGIAGEGGLYGPGKPAFVFYAAPPFHYIQSWQVLNTINCYFLSPPIVGGIDAQGRTLGIQCFPEAAHGTPLGTPYSASIWILVVLVQETT